MGLREIRIAKGFKRQGDLAEALGVDQGTISRMEKNTPTVAFRYYVRAAEVLGVTLTELFADDRTEAELLLLERWRSLSGPERIRWLEHLRIAAEGPTSDETGSGKADDPSDR